MIDVYVSTASSKEVPCKGERLRNHLEGSEIQLKDILMITQAKYYTSISRARLYARTCFYKQTRLLLMLLCKHVLKPRDDIPRYGKIINSSFLGKVCSTIFCENCLFKNILMHLSTKLVGKEFFFNTSFR